MAIKARTQTQRRQSRRQVGKARSKPSSDLGRSKPGDTKPIAAVSRALQVLSAFRASPRRTLSELSDQTGLFKSTLLRILLTLERGGYVTRLSDGQYRVGGILFELGSSYAASFDLAEIVKPALSDLSRITGESAAFYVRAGAQRQCVFRVESSQTVRHVITAGQIVDLDEAATSQLFRRYDGDARRPPARTDYTVLCVATSGVGDLQTASVAAPVFGTSGFMGVINVSGPVSRFTGKAAASCRSTLAQIASKVTASLGGFEAAAQ